MGVNPISRTSLRVKASKKAKITHVASSFKGKGKRKETVEVEDLWSSNSSKSSSESTVAQSNSEHDDWIVE